VPLGSVQTMKRSEAKRKLRAHIEEMGFNEDSHLERTEAGAKTFASEAAWWKENRLPIFKSSCQPTMGSQLQKYLLPRFGSLPMSAIDERQVQEFIADLTRMEYVWPDGVTKKLSPKTIRNIVGVLKQILGEKVWREWKLSLPEIPFTEQRCFIPQEMIQIITAASGQWKVLFATLATTGLRCGEAFGLHVEDLDLSAHRICVRRSVWNGEEVSVKTRRGYRRVNIEPALAEMLACHFRDRKGGRVFQTRNGTPFSKSNVRRKLNQPASQKAEAGPSGAPRLPPWARLGAPRKRRAGRLNKGVGRTLESANDIPYMHFRDDFREQVACDLGLFAQKKNGRKFAR
jgi:integrase